MRGKAAKTRVIDPDLKYNSLDIAKFINYVMQGGKKSTAERIVYEAMEEAAKKVKAEPLEVFQKAIKEVSPSVEVKSRRVGGSTYQVPTPVTERRQFALASRWIISAARSKKGSPMVTKLSTELADAYNSTGAAYRKKEDVLRMTEANRAFSHFATVR